MKHYVQLCLEGEDSNPERKAILEGKRQKLLQRQQALQAALRYIDWKQNFYDEVLAGEREYTSNLLAMDEEK